MTQVAHTSLYRLAELPPDPHQRMFLPSLTVGMLLWMHGSRRSSLGGYIGTFSECWTDGGYTGPKGKTFEMLTEYVSAD